MSTSLIGRTLGNYKVTEMIGRGGMATVYLAYQESIDRHVAVKVLPPHPGLDKQFIERFQNEGRTIARLQHPHILPVYDYGIEEDVLYLVMAYVKGGSLEDQVVDGPLELRQVERILREIAGAMDYAHRQNVIHRDIKPGNILIDSEGHALLADFGIAKLTEESSNLTGTSLVGTPAYMAPEQAQGLPLDSRADVYSLGVVVYQMLTGEVPFQDSTLMGVMLKIMQEEAPNLLDVRPDLPAGLAIVMDKVLAKNPSERYQTASEFAEAFSEATHDTEESLIRARAAIPLGNPEDGATAVRPAPTLQQPKPTKTYKKSDPTQAHTGESQTIIVRQATSPFVLLAGVGIIAVALVLAVVFIVGNPQTPAPATALPTSEAAAPATQAVAVNTPVPAIPSFGQASYSTRNQLGDSISLRVDGIRPPASGRVYIVWLINTENDEKLNIGELIVDATGAGSLAFTDPEARMLPATFNALSITQERSNDDLAAPDGAPVYSAMVPLEVLDMLMQILVASENGLGGSEGVLGDSLLRSAQIEARIAAQHAGLAANSTNVVSMHLHAEHTINILEGTLIDYDGNGRAENPGRGEGVYKFLDLMDEALLNVINAPGADINLQRNTEFIRICLQNTRDRVDRVVVLEKEIIAAQTMDEAQDQLSESTRVMDAALFGFDLNEDGQIQAFEGECGLEQVVSFGLLAGSLAIGEGNIIES